MGIQTLAKNATTEAPSVRLNVAAWLCGLPGLYGVIAPFAMLMPNHGFDKSWPSHARFHITWASGKLFALGINQMLLAWIPLRRRQGWSWFALASNYVFGGLAVPFASRLQLGPLHPLRTHDGPTKLAVAGMIASLCGLALAFTPVFGPDSTPAEKQPRGPEQPRR